MKNTRNSKGAFKDTKRLAVSILVVIALLLSGRNVHAQSEDKKKFEVGAQFSVLKISDPNGVDSEPFDSVQHRTEAGFGGRFGYNLNRYFALEAEVNFFPRNFDESISNLTGGRITQGLFGVKAGIRRERVGFFGKVRPGFASSGGAAIARFPDGNAPDPNNPFGFEFIRATQITLDIGGVVEIYPSRRTILRFDIGDTITRYPDIVFNTGPEDVYKHKVQFSAGFGFRF